MCQTLHHAELIRMHRRSNQNNSDIFKLSKSQKKQFTSYLNPVPVFVGNFCGKKKTRSYFALQFSQHTTPRMSNNYRWGGPPTPLVTARWQDHEPIWFNQSLSQIPKPLYSKVFAKLICQQVRTNLEGANGTERCPKIMFCQVFFQKFTPDPGTIANQQKNMRQLQVMFKYLNVAYSFCSLTSGGG